MSPSGPSSSLAQQRLYEVGQLFVGSVFDLDVSGQIFEGYVFIHPEVGQIQVGFNFSTKMSINCRVLG